MSSTSQTQRTTTIEPAIFPDGKLVQQALAGSQQAFEILVQRYNASLFRFIYSFVRDYDRASDIYQQVLIQLYVSLPNMNLEKPIRPWLFQVARHRCIDDLRRGHMVHFSELEDEYEEDYYQDDYSIPDPTPPPEELVEEGEVVRRRLDVAHGPLAGVALQVERETVLLAGVEDRAEAFDQQFQADLADVGDRMAADLGG